MSKQHQLLWGSYLLFVILTFVSYAYFFTDTVVFLRMELPAAEVTPFALGIFNTVFVIVAYLIVALVWLKLTKVLGYPRMYREGATLKEVVTRPLVIGIILGIVLLALDWLFYYQFGSVRLPHPELPYSLIASLAPAISEELFYRGLILGLWVWVLKMIFDGDGKGKVFWAANVLAAIAFAVGHLPLVSRIMQLPEVTSLSFIVILDMLVLHLVLGLVAGREYMRSGLIAAMIIHFTSSLVWHILWQFV